MFMRAIQTTLAILFLALAAPALAQDGEATTAVGPHGGVLRDAAGGTKFEVVFDREGVLVFGVDSQQRPVDLKEVEGRVEVRPQGGEARSAELKPARGRGPSRLQGRLNLARVPEGETTARVELTNVAGQSEPVVLELPFRLARLIEHACPMRCVPAQAEPGKCAKCKMDLVAAPFIYACSMHPAVTSRNANDKCWECKMALQRVGAGQQGGAHGGHGGGHDHGGGGH